MNTSGRALSRCSFLAVFLLATAIAFAQDKAEFRPTTSVRISGEVSPSGYPFSFDVYTIFSFPTARVKAGSTVVPPGYVDLQVGKEITVVVSKANIGSYRLHFSVGDDYVVYLNKLERNQFASTTASSFTAVVYRKSDLVAKPFAESTRLAVGSAVWSVSLGSLSNGTSAGSISLKFV